MSNFLSTDNYIISFYIVASIMTFIIAFYDYKTMLISNKAVVVCAAIGFITAILENRLFISLLAAFVILCFFLLISVKTDGMGGGDIKLLAALSLSFPLMDSLYFLILALSFSALSYPFLKKKTGRFPMGPGIALGYFAMILYLFL